MKIRKCISILIVLLMLLELFPATNMADAAEANAMFVASDGTAISLGTSDQKVEFTRNLNDQYEMKTYVKVNGSWKEFFNAGLPLIQGNEFDNLPVEVGSIVDNAEEKSIRLTGSHISPAYTFEILVSVNAKSPLIHFTITNHLSQDLMISGHEPTAMLWMNRLPEDKVTVYQESPNYQTVGDSTYWNSCFPAAYLWTEGMESAIFFNMDAMDWFSFNNGVSRFKNIQIRTSELNGKTGIGMDLRKDMSPGSKIANGDMVVDFYLYGKADSVSPTKMKALNKLVDAFSECFPATANWPQNHVDPGQLSYQYYSSKAAQQLMLEDITYKITPFNRLRNSIVDAVPGIWTDGPVFPENTVTQVVQRPDYAVGNLNGVNVKTADDIYGDWNCDNNTLIPWVAYERLNPDTQQHGFINTALDSLKVFYDPEAKLIRSYESSDDYKNKFVEFTFQNFFFGMNTLKASQFRDPSEFDPALGGKYLMGLEGLIALAHNVNYTFPQLFYAKEKTAATSLDEPNLGKPYDVWTGGIYAYDMCMAYDTTGQERYLTEAKNAVNKLFEGMDFVVKNSEFSAQFKDPYEFPVNEVSSAPWGVAASQWLYKKTGEAKYLEYSEYFRNITLRLMTWYESSLRDDPVDQSVQSAGLMHDFSKADTPSAWENIMTYMPMLMELKNTDESPSGLLLKMLNVFRINNFYMFGPTWDPSVLQSYATNYTSHPAGYLAVEDFYTAETPTAMGLNGPAVYMSNNPFYAYLLFEAFSECSDRDIMALNLDINDAPQKMMESMERNFIYFNPSEDAKTFTIRMKNLKDGTYTLTQTNAQGLTEVQTKTKSNLENGFEQTLSSKEFVRIKLVSADSEAVTEFTQMQGAQKKLMLAYRYLQESGRDMGVTPELNLYKASYLTAMDQYKSGDYSSAISTVDSFINKIPQTNSVKDSVTLLDPQDISPWTLNSGSNAAKGKYTSSDSGIGGRAVDGAVGPDNTWTTSEGNGTHYLVVDLGESKTINRYTIKHAGGTGNTADFEIQSSDDKATWVERDSVKGNSYDSTDRNIAPFTARYVRLYITKSAQDDGKIAQIQEFELLEGDMVILGDFSSVSRWNIAENATISTDGGTASIKSEGSSWGYAGTQLSYNVDQYPVLQIQVPSVDRDTQWNVLVNDGTGSDVFLFESSGDTGIVSVNLKNKTGWTGDKSFTLKLAVIGSTGKSFKVSNIQAVANNANILLNKPVTASSGDGSAAVDGLTANSWVSNQTTGQSLAVDLGSEKEVNRYVVKHAGILGDTNNNTVGFSLYSSVDGENWIQRDQVTDNSATPSTGEQNTQKEPLIIDMTTSAAIFAEGGATAVPGAGGTIITGSNGTNVKKQVAFNVTDYPQLEITFKNMTMPLHMQVWDENSNPIFIIPAAIASDGIYTLNLADLTSWSGEKSFYIIFYPQADGSAEISGLRALPSGYVETPSSAPLTLDTTTSQGLFAEGGATAVPSAGGTTITGSNGTNVKKKVAFNVTDYPQLEVTFKNMNMPVHMQVWDENSSPIFVIPAAISSDGTYTLNLADLTGWSGDKNFYIIFYPQAEGSAEISGLRALPLGYSDTPDQEVGIDDNFTDLAPWKYSSNATIEKDVTGGAMIRCTGGSFGYVAKQVTVNLDEFPRMQVNLSELGNATRFHVMLNDGDDEFFLSRIEMTKAGIYNFDVPMITKWSGEKTFTIKLAVIGGVGSYFKVESMRAYSGPTRYSITDKEIASFTARYLKLVIDNPGQSGDGRARVCDFEAYSTEDPGNPGITSNGTGATVSTGDLNRAFAGRLVSYDLDANPLLKVIVDEMTSGAKWNIILNDNLGHPDIPLMAEDSASTGTITFDVKALTGWSGFHSFSLKLQVTGGANKSVKFQDISAVHPEVPSEPGNNNNGNTNNNTSNGSQQAATVDEKIISPAMFKEAASKSAAGILNLKVEPTVGTNSTSVVFPVEQMIEAIQSKHFENIKIDLGDITVTLPTKVLEDNIGKNTVKLQLSVKKIDPAALNAGVSKLVGERPVYDISLLKDGKEIRTFGNGRNAVQLQIPYELQPGEDPAGIVVCYINSEGIPELVKNGYYEPAEGVVKVSCNHLSQYAIMYSKKSIEDLKGLSWAVNELNALTARGIIIPNKNGEVIPKENITRGEFVYTLISAFDLTDKSVLPAFKDVQSTSKYYSAIAAAKNLGIVSGYTSDLFGVNDPISRQDMAVILSRTLAALHFDTRNIASETKYTDDRNISSYAKAMVYEMNALGILKGIGNEKFDPQSMVTRAQSAVAVCRMLEYVHKD